MTHSKNLTLLVDFVHRGNQAALCRLLYCVYGDAVFEVFPGKPFPPSCGDFSADDLAKVINDARRLSLLPEHGATMTVVVPDHIVRRVRASA
jgi:hypothetical protein